jgi:ditrans,polycis-polyprenyl diphosphate synthase
MTMAIVKTVEQYCQPIRPRLKRPFSETHITRTIRAQRLGSDVGAIEAEAKSPGTQSGLPAEFTIVEEELYIATTAETKLALAKLTIHVSHILTQANGGDADAVTDDLAEAATNAVIHALKDPSLSFADKHTQVNDICETVVTQSQLEELQKLVDKLNDYMPPQDPLESESTTLNTIGEQSSSNPPQTFKFPDPEQITEASLTEYMYTGSNLPPLELLVRTSGVERLSDFMLWQCHQATEIAFVKCFWPDFGLKHFVPIILEYQWRKKRESYWGEAKPGWTKID